MLSANAVLIVIDVQQGFPCARVASTAFPMVGGAGAGLPPTLVTDAGNAPGASCATERRWRNTALSPTPRTVRDGAQWSRPSRFVLCAAAP